MLFILHVVQIVPNVLFMTVLQLVPNTLFMTSTDTNFMAVL